MWTLDETIGWVLEQTGQTDGSQYFRIGLGYSSHADWCAAYDSAIKVKGNLDCPYFSCAVAFDKRDMKVIGNRWVEPRDMQPGDFIGFDWDGGGQRGGDHVGFVVKRYGPGDYQTSEGNCGGAVRLKHRTIENCRTYNEDGSLRGMGIIGGIRPKYRDGKHSDKLHVDGIFGTFTAKKLQYQLKQKGYYTEAYMAKLGYKGIACLIDGDFAFYTKLALQGYLKAKQYYKGYNLDGDFAYYSVLGLQKYLKKLGYYTQEYMAKLGYKNIACLIDGDWGFYTTVALQCALNDEKF